MRVAGPLVATAAEAPVTRPLVVPRTQARQVEGVDHHELDNAAWHDPSLSSRRVILATHNLQSSDIVNFADQDPDTEEEGTEDPSLAAQRFEQAGRDFIVRAKSSSVNPIEAEPFQVVRQPPRPPPPKRQKVTIKVTSKDNDPKAVAPSPKATSESSTRFPRDKIHPWRKQEGSAAEAPKSPASEVAAVSRATSDTARSRSPRASPSTPPKAAQNSSTPVVLKPRTSNKIAKEPLRPPPPKRASSQPLSSATAKRTAKEAVASGTPQVAVAKPKGIKAPPPGVRPGAVPAKPRPVPAPPDQPKQPQYKSPPGYSPRGQSQGERVPSGPGPKEPHTATGQTSGAAAASVAQRSAESSGGQSSASGSAPPHSAPVDSSQQQGHSGNVRVCVDWHDTLDQALNFAGHLDSFLIERFQNIVKLTNNRVEFYIVSYAGWSKKEETRRAAEHLIADLVNHGIPFKSVNFSTYPCGKQGKSAVVASLGGHCLVDDRQDVLNENFRAGTKVIKSRGRRDTRLDWLDTLTEWFQRETVELILKTHFPRPIPDIHYYPNWGDRQKGHK